MGPQKPLWRLIRRAAGSVLALRPVTSTAITPLPDAGQAVGCAARTRWAPSLTPPRAACWYLAFACYALAARLAGGQALQRSWGTWAACGYGAAALAAFAWRSRGRDLALVFALAGSIAAPLAWQQTAGRGMPDGMESALWVVARSARLLLAHGSPYLPAVQLAHPLSYDPYLPAMTIFGLPGALGLPAAVGNPRLWFAVTAAIALWLAARRAVRSSAIRITAFALASPVLAFGIAVGGTDVPVLALLSCRRSSPTRCRALARPRN